jgi:hypothetical protein
MPQIVCNDSLLELLLNLRFHLEPNKLLYCSTAAAAAAADSNDVLLLFCCLLLQTFAAQVWTAVMTR